MVTAERMAVKRLPLYIDGFLVKSCTGNIDNKIVRLPIHLFKNIRLLKQANVHDLGIMRTIPEYFFILINLLLRESIEGKLIVLLAYPQDDDSASGIGERRICIPKRTRETALGAFEFNLASFFLATKTKNV